jgi:hypothetical protein
MSSKHTVSKLIAFLVLNMAICTVLFLFICDFFSSYEGSAVSYLPYDIQKVKVTPVLIVEQDGTTFQRNWDVKLVQKMELPSDPEAAAPTGDTASLPTVKKSQFTLYFRVLSADMKTKTIIPTTSPYALGVIVLLGVLALFLRNMYVSGSPLQIQRRGRKKLKTLAPMGQPANARKSRGKGPPPKHVRKGRGRRR